MISYSRLKFNRTLGWQCVRNYCSKTKTDASPVQRAKATAKTHLSSSSSSSTSSLYIKHEDLANVKVLELDLELSERFKDLQALDVNIKARKMQKKVNVYQLVSTCHCAYGKYVHVNKVIPKYLNSK